ncbi:hypothetical protein MRX96_001194 [Rhipicephalus microplus]
MIQSFPNVSRLPSRAKSEGPRKYERHEVERDGSGERESGEAPSYPFHRGLIYFLFVRRRRRRRQPRRWSRSFSSAPMAMERRASCGLGSLPERMERQPFNPLGPRLGDASPAVAPRSDPVTSAPTLH